MSVWVVTGQHVDGVCWTKVFTRRELVCASISLSYSGLAYNLVLVRSSRDSMTFMLTLDDRTTIINADKHFVYSNPEHI